MTCAATIVDDDHTVLQRCTKPADHVNNPETAGHGWVDVRPGDDEPQPDDPPEPMEVEGGYLKREIGRESLWRPSPSPSPFIQMSPAPVLQLPGQEPAFSNRQIALEQAMSLAVARTTACAGRFPDEPETLEVPYILTEADQLLAWLEPADAELVDDDVILDENPTYAEGDGRGRAYGKRTPEEARAAGIPEHLLQRRDEARRNADGRRVIRDNPQA